MSQKKRKKKFVLLLHLFLFHRIYVLRGIGVPESNILMLLNRHPRIFLYNPVQLKEIAEEVKGMRINWK
ncbi:hypothetical protein ES288_D02G150000v1 [Gossypium darwinii]|uniref:PORR domain-containing protein n=1 Tax=Gossypium darwinii TaxID=34276 RepID=A0A5D2DDW1_GOSDA|nr:hypothetical protein ES288_D02G150000v1 [Gossypium darwinii]